MKRADSQHPRNTLSLTQPLLTTQNVIVASCSFCASFCASLCASAVAETVDIEALYMKPQVRQFIECAAPGLETEDV